VDEKRSGDDYQEIFNLWRFNKNSKQGSAQDEVKLVEHGSRGARLDAELSFYETVAHGTEPGSNAQKDAELRAGNEEAN